MTDARDDIREAAKGVIQELGVPDDPDTYRLLTAALRAERARGREEAATERVPRAAMMGILASLVAAVSILEEAHRRKRQPKTVVASDKMFETMLADYHAAIETGRAAIRAKQKETGA